LILGQLLNIANGANPEAALTTLNVPEVVVLWDVQDTNSQTSLAILESMLAPSEGEFEAAMLEARGGKPFDGKYQHVVNWYDGRPAVEFLTIDELLST
jgi:hypothetical protein